MADDKWHQLFLVSEEDFDLLKPQDLKSFPVYYCVRQNGMIELWPAPINVGRYNLAWSIK